MSKKIIGVTVGTPISPKVMKEKLGLGEELCVTFHWENSVNGYMADTTYDAIENAIYERKRIYGVVESAHGNILLDNVIATDDGELVAFSGQYSRVVDGEPNTMAITLVVHSDGSTEHHESEVITEDNLEIVSPTVSVSSITGGNRVTITDAAGSKTFDVMNGAKGDPGQKGDTGATGAQGPKGDTGATGPQGPTGATGATGSAGKDGTSVTVKSVSESTADGGSNVVTFSDGKTLTVKNGSKGSKGDKGDKGDTGATGSAGAKGADGKSAYQYAVEAGYTGTEEEFANRLVEGGGSESETETVLSDNLFDKSKITRDKIFYHGTSNISLVDNPNSFYAYVPLRGAGTYYTVLRVALWGETIAKKVPICKEDNTFLQFATGTLTPIDSANSYLEFTVTDEMVAKGAAVYAFSGTTNEAYSYNHNTVMIVKDRDYPAEYIRYGYIEVPTSNAKKKSNPLCGKVAVFLGDSICAATTVEGEYYNYGWAGMIGEANQMSWTNYGKNGGTIAHRGSDGTCIANIADKAITEHPAADYVIFEGGCNDADLMREAGLGSISSDYATFDTSTFTGAFEALVLKLITAYPYAKIGYIIPPKMYARNDYTANTHLHRLYFNRAIEVCEKWGIAVVDLWRGSSLNPKLANSSLFYTDGQHLTLAGYEKIVPMIEAWMGDLYSVGSVPSVVSGNTGGGGASIDVTAEVGQTIRVKEVDASGKPTKWEAVDLQERTHWSEEVVVLEETAVIPGDAGDLLFAPLTVPSIGGTCKVTYNGTEYECEATDASAITGMAGAVIMGNLDLFTGVGDTGEPFVLVIAMAGEGGAQLIPMDSPETVVLSIKTEAVAKMPVKYIPDEVSAYAPYYLNVFMGIDDADNPAWRTLTSVAQLEAMIDAGRMVIAKVQSTNFGTYYLHFCNDNTTADGKRRIGFAAAELILVLVPQDDGTYIGESNG